MQRTSRRILTAALVLGAPAAWVLVPASGAQAEAMKTTNIKFVHKCRVDYATINQDFDINEDLAITAPESVRPGEEFTITMRPGLMKTSTRTTGRMKYDLLVPTGTDVVSYKLMPNTALNLGGAAPVVLQVNESGQVDKAGPYLRIVDADNMTINDGPNANPSDPGRGISVKSKTEFRFPGVEVRLRAKQGVTEVRAGVRPGAEKHAVKINNTSISYAEVGAPLKSSAYCVATGDGRSTRSVTEVYAINQTATTVDVDLAALTGDDVKVSATVRPNPGEGTIQLYDGQKLVASLPVDKQGHAETVWKFAEHGEHPITAKFVGTKKFAPSVSDAHQVIVSAPGVVVVEPEPQPGDPDEPAPTFRVNLSEMLGFLGSSGNRPTAPAAQVAGEQPKDPAPQALSRVGAGPTTAHRSTRWPTATDRG